MVAGAAVAVLALLLVLWSARRGARQDGPHAAACC
jgi:hypothetical protein